ncbi:Zinc-finger homeodomain protein [Actinidia chinensis var. chinensis]|uniref:Zinc-finger homeodomain protein n=1 Tax=Actinidia chinensis var. chinensis TaxID=1590841 RepID=A0A2R6R6N3_ACTCC|nr:Zinc-finger homeodomain protein [Actinidia chinensis var. chinensis]
MELSSQEGEVPIPINISYGRGHMIHHGPAPVVPHNHIIIPNSAPQVSTDGSTPTALDLEDHGPYKKMVRYRECLKNHAASMGGNARDGCGEFMPNGEEGTIEALYCSACNCHRNFHRKEIEGEPSSCECFQTDPNRVIGRKLIMGQAHHKNVLGPDQALGPLGYYPSGGTLIPSRQPPAAAAHHQMMMSYNVGSFGSESDELEEGGGGGGGARPPQLVVKKRFRTKFSQEQKEKMLGFAERVGWKFQKQEEAVVQQFCQEIGVKRRVLKVWMHNNKHNIAKKSPSSIAPNPI